LDNGQEKSPQEAQERSPELQGEIPPCEIDDQIKLMGSC
jgi:hypothetical protein